MYYVAMNTYMRIAGHILLLRGDNFDLLAVVGGSCGGGITTSGKMSISADLRSGRSSSQTGRLGERQMDS